MKFTVVTNDAIQNTSNASSDNAPDWDKINAEKREKELAIIKMLETQDESSSLSAIVSSYVDLGIQERGEYEDLYVATDPKHIEKLANGSFVEDRYNRDAKKKVPTICTPAKPAKAFVLGIDFPQYMVDYGGEIGERPFRMFMGGKFFIKNPDSAEGKKMAIVQNPMYMVENTNNPQNKWALPVTSMISKMCVAAGLGDEHGLVSKDAITGLLGKALQFEVRVWDKPAKVGDATYYTENIKFVGKLPKGMPVPELDSKFIFGVNMTSANDPEMVKQLRAEHKNTMKLATNWEGSVLQKELAELRSNGGGNIGTQAPVSTPDKSSSEKSNSVAPTPVNVVQKQPEPIEDINFDDDKYPF
jgi:hypothetical protein